MRIPAFLYFCCWALGSSAFLRVGFYALDQERLTNIPPFVIHIFKLFLGASVLDSSYRALFISLSDISLPVTRRFRLLLHQTQFGVLFPTWMGFRFDHLAMFLLEMKLSIRFSCVYLYAAFMIISPGRGDRGLGIMMQLPVFLHSFMRLMKRRSSLDDYWQVSPSRERYSSTYASINNVLEIYKMKETVKFGVAMFVSILFQNYVKFSAFSHVLAFLCFAAAWLGCIALRMSSQDYGVLYFLLSNVIVGCTANTFELRSQTWFAYTAVVLLFGLRRGLEAVRSVPEEDVVLIEGIGNESNICFSRKVSRIVLLTIYSFYCIYLELDLISAILERRQSKSN